MTRPTSLGVTSALVAALVSAGLSSAQARTAPHHSDASAVRAAERDASVDEGFGVSDRARAIAMARRQTDAVKGFLRLSGAQKLTVTDVERDTDGSVHVRYARRLGGLPVVGGDFVVHRAPSGAIESADFASDRRLALATDARAAVSAARAQSLAARSAGAAPSTAGPARKVVWAIGGKARMAWLTETGGATPRAVAIDAMTGETIQSWDLHQEAQSGKGRTLYSGQVELDTSKSKNGKWYVLRDKTRGNSRVTDLGNKWGRHGAQLKDADNTWGNAMPTNRQSAAADAAYGAAMTWDYYSGNFGREGIRGNGRGAESRVHAGKKFDNAYWDDACFCMTYGDGGRRFKPLVSLDVVGHEMTHGVTSRTAGLDYWDEMGGLNESSSDIFGSMIEFSAGNQKDPGDYIIGEEISRPKQGRFLRRMDRPSADGRSFDCWTPTLTRRDPHYTSGVGNHFFYLLAEGSGMKEINGIRHNSSVCPGAAEVQGIGREVAADIWYRTLTRYLVSTSHYSDARDASIHAAIDLFGADSDECAQVVLAWDAVAVPELDWTCAGPPDFGDDVFGANPGFEQKETGWTLDGPMTVVTSAFDAHSGKRYASFFKGRNAGHGSLTRALVVPDSETATMRVFIRIAAYARKGTLDFTVNGEPIPDGLGHFDQTDRTDMYQRLELPVGDWAGQTVNLEVDSAAIGKGERWSYWSVAVDDFSLTPR